MYLQLPSGLSGFLGLCQLHVARPEAGLGEGESPNAQP
jgi:hypothetical protein